MNNTPAGATLLDAVRGYRTNAWYEALGCLEDSYDLDWYLLTSPQPRSGSDVVLTVTFLLPELNGTLPYLWVYDQSGQFLAEGFDVLLNGDGTYTLQVPDLVPETPYYTPRGPK